MSDSTITVETAAETATDTTTVTQTAEPVMVTLERDPKSKGHGAHRVLVPADEVDAWLAVGWYYA